MKRSYKETKEGKATDRHETKEAKKRKAREAMDLQYQSLYKSLIEDSEAQQERELKRQALEALNKEEEINYDLPSAIWRHGPAKFWYDQMGLPVNANEYHYSLGILRLGVEVAKKQEKEDTDFENLWKKGAFDLSSQVNWESDIIWNPEDIIDSVKNKQFRSWNSDNNKNSHPNSLDSQFSSHEEDIMADWEDNIIWDVDNIMTPNLLQPILPFVDKEILDLRKCIAIGPNPVVQQVKNATEMTVTKRGRKPKYLQSMQPSDKEVNLSNPKLRIDSFNISNDEQYGWQGKTRGRLVDSSGSKDMLRHAIPVLELQAPFIPTKMPHFKTFHRPVLKKYNYGNMAKVKPHPVHALTSRIFKKAKEHENKRLYADNTYQMLTADDLSGKDGRLILMEYSEQYPPLMSEVGMCSKIVNYSTDPETHRDRQSKARLGEAVPANPETFLGEVRSGEVVQTIENNLYRAPIFEHDKSGNDFVLFRNRSGFALREFSNLFTVGQECPLYEVPNPTSRATATFVRDFLLIFVCKQLLQSREKRQKVAMNDVRKAFPQYTEAVIKNKLKAFMDFEKKENKPGFLVVKPEARLPLLEDLKCSVTPEQFCAHFSQIAAKQRLKEAGYGVHLTSNPDDDEVDFQTQLGEEVQCAPWNTTKAYIEAQKGKCHLQLDGPADPTGCRQGFSYVRVANKPQKEISTIGVKPTDHALHNLTLEQAKQKLKTFKVSQEKIQNLSREEAIALLGKKMRVDNLKKRRVTKEEAVDFHKKYQAECQRIFDKQIEVLQSSEFLPTDDEDSEEEEVALHEMGKEVEKLLCSPEKKFDPVKEEEGRMELLQMMKI